MSIHLLPEIEAGLRAEADARGVTVDALVAEVLGTYVLQNKTPSCNGRSNINLRSEEMAWAASPDLNYAGKWVVLEGREVIASGPNPKTIYDEVRRRGIASPFLIYVSPESQEEPFAGGWLD
jgi:hypothetical protein